MKQGHLFFALILALVFAPALFATKIQAESATCGEQKFNYLLFVPAGDSAVPAILLLHGAGDTRQPMVEAWRNLAEKEKIALIAPELPRRSEFEAIAPQVFHCVVEDAKHHANLDVKRLYVFGNSMGGYLAYDALAFLSDYFAAVGVHAMGIDPQYDSILDHATRKTPVAIYIGDHDQLVSLKNVQRTRDLLLTKGFPVHYTELKNHDHNYYSVSDKVNPDVLRFFLAQRLP